MSWRHLNLLINALHGYPDSVWARMVSADLEKEPVSSWKPPGVIPETEEDQMNVLRRAFGK